MSSRPSLRATLKRIVGAAVLGTAAWASSASALTFLTEENPPLNHTQNGQLAGIAVDVVREMATHVDISPDYQVLPWTQALSRAETEPDACVFSTVPTPDRFKRFQWVGPVARGEYSLFGREGFAHRLTRVDELKRFRIGAVRDARGAWLRQNSFANVFEFDDDRHIPLNLTADPNRAGGIDLWLTQGAKAQATATAVGVSDIKLVFRGILSQDYWLACHPGLPRETVQALNAALAAMREDGTYLKIVAPELSAPR